jgi:hypothetical protein
LAEVENAASAILLSLRTMQHADIRTVPKMRATLRHRLQDFVSVAMAAARGVDQ